MKNSTAFRILTVLILGHLAFISPSCAQQSNVPSLSPTEVNDALQEGNDFVLFDVRRLEEINRGVIDPDIINYDFYADDFKDNVAKLDRDDTYYVYCHAGGRSAKTVKMMQDMGFKNVFNVDGGITKWKADGMKLVSKK